MHRFLLGSLDNKCNTKFLTLQTSITPRSLNSHSFWNIWVTELQFTQINPLDLKYCTCVMWLRLPCITSFPHLTISSGQWWHPGGWVEWLGCTAMLCSGLSSTNAFPGENLYCTFGCTLLHMGAVSTFLEWWLIRLSSPPFMTWVVCHRAMKYSM